MVRSCINVPLCCCADSQQVFVLLSDGTLQVCVVTGLILTVAHAVAIPLGDSGGRRSSRSGVEDSLLRRALGLQNDSRVGERGDKAAGMPERAPRDRGVLLVEPHPSVPGSVVLAVGAGTGGITILEMPMR